MKEILNDFNKVERVINSSVNEKQIESCFRLITNFENKWKQYNNLVISTMTIILKDKCEKKRLRCNSANTNDIESEYKDSAEKSIDAGEEASTNLIVCP